LKPQSPDLDGSDFKSIITVASFENADFHTIRYATTNIKQLGFSIKQLLGSDLDLLISNSVAKHHKLMCVGMMKSNEYVARVTGMETYIKDSDGRIQLSSVYYRLYPHLREGLQFAGKLHPTTIAGSSDADMTLMLDTSCTILDVCRVAAEKFSLHTCISSFSQELFSFIRYIDHRSREESILPSTEETSLEDKENQEFYKMAVSFLGQWLPIKALGISYQMRLSRVVISVVNSTVYVLNLRPAKQTEASRDMSIFVSMMKLHNDSLFNAIASVPRVEDQILQYVRRVMSSISVDKSKEEEKKVLAFKKLTRRDRCFQKNYLPANIEEEEQASNFVDLELPDLKHSRFIHHNINFKGIKPLLSAISLPLILLCVAVVCLMQRERDSYTLFTSIHYDVTARDSESYVVWALLLHVQHNELRRFILQKHIPEDIFKEFGVDHLSSHLYSLTSSGFADQLYSNLLRMHRAIYNSSYFDLYDVNARLSTTVTIKILNLLDQTVEFAPMGVMAATKYSQQMINSLLLAENILDLPREAEVARFNLLNPLARHLLAGRIR